MIKIVDECVGCTDLGLPCKGIGCPNREVERHYCDDCESSEATCTLDGEELCDDCMISRLDSLWNKMRCEEKADALDIDLEWLNG